ncbi:MAG: hypothetical protein WCS56_00345 [Bacilli bacterium]
MNTKDILRSKKELDEDVQGIGKAWNYVSYRLGVYNGTELMLATIEGRDPIFATCQEDIMEGGLLHELTNEHPYINPNREPELLNTRRDINEGERYYDISKRFR